MNRVRLVVFTALAVGMAFGAFTYSHGGWRSVGISLGTVAFMLLVLNLSERSGRRRAHRYAEKHGWPS